MRICLSLQNPEGLRLSGHFGDTPWFALYDTRSAQFSVGADDATCRGPCRCHMPVLRAGEVDAVICRSIGVRALAQCRQQQIPVYLTQEADAVQAILAWQSAKLEAAQRGNCRPEVMVQRQAARRAPQ